jgi:4-amino-4-deoxy-L-arabinose transferase-like glycosyltransferase
MAALALALKAVLLALHAFPFNADEAIVALMARHILQGARPTFFYGQAYMGSLDAALVSAGFSWLGEKVVVVRLVQSLLYAGTVASTVVLAARLTRSRPAALAAGLLMAVPTVNVSLYTTVSLGGYGEALLLGNLVLLTALSIVDHPRSLGRHLLWGALSGLGFWAFALTLIYILPTAVVVAWVGWRDRHGLVARAGTVLAGALLGAAPWLAWAVRNGLGPLLAEAGGSAIAGVGPSGWAAAIGLHLVNLLLFGSTAAMGLRPPWEIRWLAPWLAPLAASFWLAALVGMLRRAFRGRIEDRLLAGVAVALALGFVLTPFGVDGSGRYFVPLATPMAVFGAALLVIPAARLRPALAWGAVGAVLAFNLWGNLETALRNPPGITTQFDAVTQIDHRADSELIEFLRSQGERRGYTNYWVAYPLAFLSAEELVFVPRLPYHPDFRYTARDDRYPPYDDVVGESDRVAYITTRFSALDERLRDGLGDLGVTFQERAIGDYRVFFDLSRPVSPEALGLPAASAP